MTIITSSPIEPHEAWNCNAML